MTILVDDLFDAAGPRGHARWCHMGTDDHTDAGLAELHTMAARIGLRRSWFQDKPRFPHYDLTPPKRTAAIAAGAVAVDAFVFVARVRRDIPGKS